MKPTKVTFHIQQEDFVNNILIDSPFDIIPNVGDLIVLEGYQDHFIVIRKQFMQFASAGNHLAIIIKKP